MKKWPVWMEGYAATGDRASASYQGEFEGETFADACKAWSRTLPLSEWKLFNEKALTFWGCSLYDNEKAARKHFG